MRRVLPLLLLLSCAPKAKPKYELSAGAVVLESPMMSDAGLAEFAIATDSSAISVGFFQSPNYLQFDDEKGQVVRIDLHTGNVEYGEHVTPDYAARIFWRLIERTYRETVPLCREVKR